MKDINGKYFKLSFNNYPIPAYIYVIEASISNDEVLLEAVLVADDDRIGWASYVDWKPLSRLQEITKEEFIVQLEEAFIKLKKKYNLLHLSLI